MRRRASYGFQRQASATCLAQCRRTVDRRLWEGGAALELEACARRAALVVVGGSPLKGHFAGKSPLSFVARLWFDAPAAASNAKPAPIDARVRRVLHSLSLRRRRTSRTCCAVGVCCAGHGWLALVQRALCCLRGLSPSTRARDATCQLWPPTPSQRRGSHAAQAHRRSLSLGRRRSTRA